VSFCALSIFESLLSEEGDYQPVSVPIPDFLHEELGEERICLSLYCKIDRNGVVPDESYRPSEGELKALKQSFNVIRDCLPHKYL
jgi:malate/lactate dehydrogenase